MKEKNMSEEEVLAWGNEKAKELTLNQSSNAKEIIVKLSQTSTIKAGEKRTYRCGQLFLQDIYSQLRFKITPSTKRSIVKKTKEISN